MEERTYTQLIENSIRMNFERSGIVNELRSGLHVNVLKAIREELYLDKDGALCGGDVQQRGLLQLLNYLVVDYFDWYGYKHTLETFALETGDKALLKPREKLMRELSGNYDNKELPVLLQMLMKQTKKDASKKLPQPIIKSHMAKDIPPEGNPSNIKELLPPEAKASHIKKLPAYKMDTPRDFKPRLIKKDTRNPPSKVKVRQSMIDSVGPKQSTPIKQKSAELGVNKYGDEYESSSKSSTGSYSNDSDAFDDIPDRHYYIEQEPPETMYPHDFGEEGRCEAERNTMQIVELPNSNENTEQPQGNSSNRNTTKETNTVKRRKILSHSHKHANPYGFVLDRPVQKPKCPETMVSQISLDGDSEYEDSDEYF
ncbi:uncharacterized protein LOC6563913 [Drosophila grimshawi]|uniref:GH18218 n=1 Tax=Drosophila grimshawi TaxID=7222 RepID=B4JFS3_DROGR|nr:uncharacterized protein LOC6563913 [Drosophila grimshawi]EDV93554.1 GH18218 [Drosophila grimshawi]